ncbi:MAG: amidohydrolase [Kineosporiaceae bacterium]
MNIEAAESLSRVEALLAPHLDDVLTLRRDLHAHPETGHHETRTTGVLVEFLRRAGLQPQPLPGTGLTCDLGPALRGDGTPSRRVLLRADIDALPVQEDTDLPWRSRTDGVAHACGHDVHTAALAGAARVLADLDAAGHLGGRVRLVFQPAEEVQPGGALEVIAAGRVEGVDAAYAMHCDPRTDVGSIGCRIGAITSAADLVSVELSGKGGHTSRPHLTGDVVFALSQVITQLPAVLSRRIDPRAGLALVWGRVQAGAAYNAIPRTGLAQGTLRCLDLAAWQQVGAILEEVVHDLVRPYDVRASITHVRGVPPTVNHPDAVAVVEDAAHAELGPGTVVLAEQSLGGEDFGWVLERVPGAMFRLGTRTPGGRTYDLHQGDFVPDERAVAVGARMLVAVALRDLAPGRPARGATP